MRVSLFFHRLRTPPLIKSEQELQEKAQLLEVRKFAGGKTPKDGELVWQGEGERPLTTQGPPRSDWQIISLPWDLKSLSWR